MTRNLLKNMQMSDCRKQFLSIDMQISVMVGGVCHGEVIQCLDQLMK